MTDGDDLPTPRDGSPVSTPDGLIRPEDLRAHIDARLRHRVRRLWGAAWVIATALAGVAGGVIKSHGDNRASAERSLVRLEMLERAVLKLQDDERDRQRDELQRLRAPWSAPATTSKGNP